MRQGSVKCTNELGHHRMSYYEWGDTDNPRVLICVHGLTRNAMDFRYLAEALSADYRVICPDVVGRGASDWLPDGVAYELGQYLKDLNQLLTSLELTQVDWVGTSMGGILGMMLASLPGSPIRHLVLNDIAAFVPAESIKRIRGYIGITQFATMAEAEQVVRQSFLSYADLSDEQWAHLARYSVREIEGGFTQHYDPALVAAFGEGDAVDIDLAPWFSQVSVPMMLVYGGESDIVSDSVLSESVSLQPDLHCLRVEDAPHAPALIEADQVAAIASWLASFR